ncbi:MAG TPA: STN domain-containing protein [Pirellulales bacterium]
MKRGLWVYVALWIPCATSVGADTPWVTGEALGRALTRKIDLAWSNIPLRGALVELAKSQKIAVILDRRVDPGEKIELSLDAVPLAEAIQRIASREQIGSTLLGSIAYFGPVATAERLKTIAALRKNDVEALPSATRATWRRSAPMKWDDLARPRELLAALAQENGLKIEGLDQIPHDLWAAVDLPPLPLADRLTLVLCQFDLTFEIEADGLSLRLAPMPQWPVIERTYAVPSESVETAATQLKQSKLLRKAEIRAVDGKLLVSGREEDQQAVAELLAGHKARQTTVTEGQKVYSLRVELPLDQLLPSLARKMGLELHVDDKAISAAGLSIGKTVKVDVKEVSGDELLSTVLQPAGLTFAREGNVLTVKPAK